MRPFSELPNLGDIAETDQCGREGQCEDQVDDQEISGDLPCLARRDTPDVIGRHGPEPDEIGDPKRTLATACRR